MKYNLTMNERKRMKQFNNLVCGQAMVTLLFFMIIAITITSAAVTVLLVNSLSGAKLQQGVLVRDIAEAGVENALLSLIRNPSYTGETLTVGGGNAEITVTGVDPKLITSKGRSGDFLRTIQVQAQYNDNILTVLSWREVF